jgi:hypothetical protein
LDSVRVRRKTFQTKLPTEALQPLSIFSTTLTTDCRNDSIVCYVDVDVSVFVCVIRTTERRPVVVVGIEYTRPARDIPMMPRN